MVLIFLNLFCTRLSQRLFYENKESAMIEKCQLASDELSTLDVWNNTTVSGILSQLESLRASRLLVTDSTGLCIYDSTGDALNRFVLLPEVLSACQGNDVFTWRYHNGAMISRAATPIVDFGSVAGCVYITEYDTAHTPESLKTVSLWELFLILPGSAPHLPLRRHLPPGEGRGF